MKQEQPEQADLNELVLIGIIIKPHGIRGEVKVKPLTDFPSRFQELKRIFLLTKDSKSFPLTVIKANVLHDLVIVGFAEIDSITAAKKLVGDEIAIPRCECVRLPSDSYYVFDLIGMRVVLSQGKWLGTVVDVQSNSAQDLLVVDTQEHRQVLVPFVNNIVTTVSLPEKQITVVDLPGLFSE